MGIDLGSGKAGIHDTLVVHRRYEFFFESGNPYNEEGFRVNDPLDGMFE